MATCNDDKLDSIATLLASKKNIIVLVGAGISVAAGIPDFRSHTTGLYNTINLAEYGVSSPEELFDIDIFTDNPTPFYKFAKSFGYYDETDNNSNNENINNTKHKFKSSTISHYFLAQLAKNKQLRRIYTQNIDGLEILAGVPPSKIVYAHGSLANGATCMNCSALYSAHDIAEDVRFGRVPLCTRSCSHTQHCKPQKSKKLKLAVAEAATAATITNPDYNLTETLSSTTPTITVAVTAVKKRTSTRLAAAAMISSSTIAANKSDYNHDDENNVLRRRSLLIMKQQCGGIIKPNITFFGEKLNNQVGQWLQKDCNVADALLVMGTSLSV
jgi:NAD-dependent SIR2 family protein deacetylase